ncbi:hypothetical protein BaRGS_00029978 [Batillaria attramentaria]|uniref:Uncharacterized protein n=1 Tax=Batillaria attramentaria TaxID=370345 RepID=A0ABD0JUY8_9CAEN
MLPSLVVKGNSTCAHLGVSRQVAGKVGRWCSSSAGFTSTGGVDGIASHRSPAWTRDSQWFGVVPMLVCFAKDCRCAVVSFIRDPIQVF